MSKGIIANSVMNAAAGMLLLLTGFVSSIITARLLGPEANGIVAFSLWLVMTGASIAELGSSITLLKTLPQLSAEGYDAGRRRGFAAILVSFMMFSTVLLLALYALFFLTSEEMHWAKTAPSVALVTGVLFFVQAIGSFVKFYLIGEKRLGSFFKLTVAVSIIQLAGVAAGAVLYGVEGVLVGYALGQLVLFFATLPILLTRRDWCGVSLKYLASSSIILSIQFIIDSIFLNRLELLFLQQFWSVEMVGYYAVGLSIANIALQLPIQMTGSLLPYYSERRHSSDDSTLPVEVFAAVTRSMAYIVLPMSLGLAAISSELVLVLFGEAFRRSGTVVALLALVAPAYTFMQILSLYLLSMDKVRSRLNISVIGGLLMVAGCLLIVPRLAAEGAAIVRILVFVAMSVMMIRQTGFGSQLSGLYASLTKVTLASVLCACAAISVLEFVHGPIGLISAIIAGMLAHFAALRVLRAVPLEDVEVMRSIVEKMPSALRRPVGRVIDFIAPGRPGDPDRAKVAPGELSLEPAEGAGRSAALPVAFDGTIGLFMPENPQAGKRSAAVLFVSPWGFEEMCSRKFFRVAAEHFSDIGVPSLRFDYRGTGDALDFGALPARLETWENSIRAAAAKLKSLTGCDRIILIGQGLGATLAQRIGSSIEGVDSLVMLAPVLSGRAYMRELNMWSKIIDADLGLGHEHVQAAKVQIAGLVMPEEIAAELGKLNIAAPQGLAASRYLILERPVRAEDTGFADALQALGANVEQKVFDGYDELVTNPLFAKTPMDVVELLTAWLKTATAETSAAHSPAAIETTPLAGEGFLEMPVRFGSHDHLVGVVSRPLGEIKGNAVLFLSTAYDRHAGWGRTTVDMARELARQGVVSLRFDSANVGDSPPRPDAPEQVLYSMTQTDDAIAALDLLESVVAGPIMVAGRCSGGYVAFRAGVADERLKAVVSINPFVYYWDPKVPVRREHVVSVPRSLDDYGQRLARLDTLKRLLRGQVDVVSALRNIVIAGGRRLSPFVAPLLELLPDRRHIAREVRQSFALFGRRKVPLTLIYSEGDVGLDHVYFHFGPRGARLSRYSNVRLLMLPDADHNLTPPQSRKFVLDEIIRLARA
ncbi:O-antigen/teichoic acid export membrane protein/pimeloyl-ACP methyl ester carboxylesterase [Rhizobium aethiopicum]|uniref:O-antigen/teichoic acid export membrane protein/pimeloyl-ACP methyl ester carboxylesterase n=1 Tax=Rhizobium aethiopicum TaxID=1138170 RepID=A0A7W6MEK5_9HYPH|nr:alpha/beta fold hydrolase [Rhizobium aethiopicum]MBB4191124.1 O-antigen/teichoic acid export membrane protein/pimeloyl-ACP methyl ester carboxylesterase [Rhizobium aethiopicum]MBB4580121.1 O-antigen/teichoic acid export membrane protein/pimeloyl-ACP methyl ester carboxylesterase [Rhizobium aethiopicum]